MKELNFKINKSWTLFLDRDGVINKRNFNGYITSVEEFIFYEKALEAICHLSRLFGKIIIVTNQQGIAKKSMTKRNLEEIHRYMLEEIYKAGGKVDAIFVADNLKNAKNDRRKPLPTMAFEAKEQFPTIDFEKSVMVGDTDSDIKFGMNLGMKTIGVRSDEILSVAPTILVDDLMELYKKLR